MPYEIGTASGYTDLLDRLIDFLTNPARTIGDDPDIDELVAIDDLVGTGESSQAWTNLELNDDRDSSGDGDMEVYLMAPGTSGTDEIYCWIDTVSNVSNDYYNWRLSGMTGYSSLVDIESQPGVMGGRAPRMLLWTGSIPYWFLGNGRRFVVVAKVSSVYESCYGGFCLPYGLPTQFPYLLCIGGSACPGTTASHNRYSSTELNHRAFMSPYGSQTVIIASAFDATAYYSTLKVLQGTSWITMGNFESSEATFNSSNTVWPYNGSTYTYAGGDNAPYNIFSTGLRENLDGSYPIFPCVITIQNPNNHISGELDGIFAVPGFGGIAAEDTFDVNGDTYIAFPIAPNADRKEWFCIKKE